MRLFALLALLLLSSSTQLSAEPKESQPEGITLTGRVICEGQPMEGVLVSDGALFTKTDSLGVYRLASLKYYGAVFVVTPSGYEPVTKRGIFPQFYAPTDSRKIQKLEQHDFELRRVDNSRHRMIFTADMHLSGRNEDMIQLKRLCIPALKRAVESVKDSVAVYSIMLGDLCRNDSWYSHEIDPSDAMSALAMLRYPVPLYTVMGENEYDGAVKASVVVDHKASEYYVRSCAPRFYSMNIGKVHYIVLDNTVFRNEAGDGKYPTEIVGKRNYDRRVSKDQLSWLRRDLEFVEDKSTPIVVCMHHSVMRASAKGEIVKALSKPEDTDSLIACFKDFSSVRFVTAHAHRRRVSAPKSVKNIVEHTVSSISGNGWETAYNGYHHMTSDGSAAGFEVFDYNGRDVVWKYCTIQEDKRPFRAYDMQSVGEYYRTTPDVVSMLRAHEGKKVNYGAEGFANYVYVNFWGDEPGSKIEMWEGERPLKVRRVSQDDPLFTLASAVVRHKNARGRKISLPRTPSQHLFRAKTDSLLTPVIIRTTSPFGEVFTDTLVRPVAFPPKAPKL